MRISVSKAKTLLEKSHPVAIPTETVWGLSAPLQDEKAIERIFTLKGRPRENPLIIHISDFDELYTYAIEPLPPHTTHLAKAFWPGPMTLVIPCKTDLVPSIARAGLQTAGFRVPRSAITRKLLQHTGPLVAPSANVSGRPSATEIQHVEEDFGSDFPCLETDEKCECGIESTILVYIDQKWQVGRLGALSLKEIAQCIGYIPKKVHSHEKPLCPGQKFRHYAPKAHLTLSRSCWQSEWGKKFGAIIGFDDRTYEGAHIQLSLGSSDKPKSAEQALYRALRTLDDLKIERAWIDCSIPYTAEWEPLLDRLEKASSN